jgi:type II secretory pathway component PulF
MESMDGMVEWWNEGTMPTLVVIQLLGGFSPLILGLAVLAALRVLSARRDPHADSMHLMLTVASWVLIDVGLLALLTTFSGPMGAMVGAVIIAMAAHRARRTQQYALLSILAATAERMMPLVPAIEAYAREHVGTMGRRAMGLADRLRAGIALPDAMAACPGTVPPEAMPIIRTGYESGALAAALSDATSLRRSGDAIWNQVLSRTAYLAVLLLVFLGISTFMVLKIMPAVQKIFEDFGTELPAMTQAAVSLSYASANYWFLLTPLVLAAGIPAVYAVLRYVGWIEWRLPGTGWLNRRLDTAAVFDSLSIVADRRRPMPDGLASLARSFPVASVRGRLRRVLADVEAGEDWAESLRRHELIGEAELAVIAAAGRAGNLSWALRELAESNRRRWGYRAVVWLQILFPVVIVSVGFLVALYVVGYFLPLVTLIQSMTYY